MRSASGSALGASNGIFFTLSSSSAIAMVYASNQSCLKEIIATGVTSSPSNSSIAALSLLLSPEEGFAAET